MWKPVQTAFSQFVDDNCPMIAAALAYYTMFSLAPLLVIVLTLCGFFLDADDVHGRIAYEVRSVVGAQGAEQIKEMIANVDTARGSVWMTVLGVGTLLFGATGVMVQLQYALNKVWNVKPNPDAGGIWNFIIKRLVSLAMLMGIAFILLVSLVISWALKLIGEQAAEYLPGEVTPWVWMLGHEILLTAIATILFAAMFAFLPDAKVRLLDVLTGALTTAVLFVGGKYVIGAYLANSSMGEAYGAAGSLVLILVWVYFSAMLFLLGAEFTQAWTQWRGHRVRPQAGAVRVVEREVTVDAEPLHDAPQSK